MRRRISMWVVIALMFQCIFGIQLAVAADAAESAGVAYTAISPTVAVYSPSINATNVNVDSPIIITFNTSVRAGSGYVTINSSASTDQISVTDAAKVTVKDNIVVIKPSRDHQPNTRYYVNVSDGAFVDAADPANKFTGFTGTDWSFTTGAALDKTPPSLRAFSPTNGSTVSGAVVLTLTFDEAVAARNGANNIIKIYDASNSRVVESITATAGQVKVDGANVRITPTASFIESGKTYYVEVGSGAFADLAGNSFGGITGTTVWRFTMQSTDTVKPAVESQVPANGTTNVAISTNIALKFNEDISLVNSSMTVTIRPTSSSTSSITGNITLDSDKRTLRISPRSSLVANTTYTIDIPQGLVRDLAGNLNDARYGFWSFTTTIVDRTAPVLQSSKMYSNTAIVLKYNELLNTSATPSVSAFTASVNDEARGVSSVSVSGDSVYVYLQSGVAVGQVVRLSYNAGSGVAIQDPSGNKASSFTNRTIENSIETTLPKITSGYVSSSTVVLNFSDSLSSVSSYAYTQFKVTVNGSIKNIKSNSTYNGSYLYLYLDSSVTSSDVVKVSYTPGSYPIKGNYDIQMASFSDFFIRNYSDNVAPVLSSTSVSGTKLTMVYNEALDENSIPKNSYLSVLVNNTARYVTAVSIKQNIIELTLASAVTQGQEVTLSYAPGDPRIRDLNGNNAQALNLVAVGITLDTQLPYVKSSSASGDTITLNLSKKVTATGTLGSAQFPVKVDGVTRAVSSVTLSSDSMVITIRLAAGVTSGQKVTVSYVPGNTALRDVSGNAMSAFTDSVVGNSSSATSTSSGSALLNQEQGYTPYVSTFNILKKDYAKTSTDRSRLGKSINRYTIDKDKLDEAFSYVVSKDSSQNKMIMFDVPTTERAASVAIPLQSLENAYVKSKNSYFAIRFGDIIQTIPLANLNFGEMTRSFNASTNNITLLAQIEPQDPSNSSLLPLNAQLSSNNAQALSDIYDFRLSAMVSVPTPKVLDVTAVSNHTLKINQAFNKNQAAAVHYDASVGKLSYAPTVFGKQVSSDYASFMGGSNDMYRLVTGTVNYTDVQNHWAKDDINKLASKFVIEGRNASQFMPNAPITRAEFAVFVARALGLNGDKSAAAKFKDVPTSTVTAAYIGASSKAGIIQGNSDGTFGSNNLITREQMALMITRAMTAAGKGVTLESNASNLLSKFSDRGKISKTAQEAVAKVLQAEIVTGMTETTFQPQGNATRVQAVLMLSRMMKAIQYID